MAANYSGLRGQNRKSLSCFFMFKFCWSCYEHLWSTEVTVKSPQTKSHESVCPLQEVEPTFPTVIPVRNFNPATDAARIETAIKTKGERVMWLSWPFYRTIIEVKWGDSLVKDLEICSLCFLQVWTNKLSSTSWPDVPTSSGERLPSSMSDSPRRLKIFLIFNCSCLCFSPRWWHEATGSESWLECWWTVPCVF